MNEKHLYTTLGATVQSGSVTDETITDTSVIEIYFDDPDVYIKSSSQSGHTVNFTVDGNLTGVNVCVVVNNLTDFVPFDGEGIENRVSALESDVDTITTEMETISTEVENLDNKVDNLSASNINYDEHSTLYSAMGDIDELETTSKNLVGAINEIKESCGGGVPLPDYNNSILITDNLSILNGQFTAPSNGVINGYLQRDTTNVGNCALDINGVNVAVYYGSGTRIDYQCVPFNVIISKDETIKTNTYSGMTSIVARFIPFKGGL